jgi:hypothetical protein
MANAVPRLRKVTAVVLRGRSQISVSVSVSPVDLECLVVTVLERYVRGDSVVFQGLKLHPDQWPKHVVEKDLVNIDSNTVARVRKTPVNMVRQYLPQYRLRALAHGDISLGRELRFRLGEETGAFGETAPVGCTSRHEALMSD